LGDAGAGMFLLNLTWLQFAALFGGISAGVVALYLWDRTHRRLIVPTLKFWIASEQPAQVRRRRRIRQPLSLLLQLASIVLLLLALAQLRIGSPEQASRDHVVILDTSAWMSSRSGDATLMELAQAAARAYVRALTPGNRAMLVRADALATPATAFESSRQALEDAIDHSRPGSTALKLGQAFEFARQAQRLQPGRPGEIVYVGPGRITDSPDELARENIPNLRVLSVPDRVENCGLEKIGIARGTSDPDTWHILAGVRNYGAQPRTVTLSLSFGGESIGSRKLLVAPGAGQSASFELRTREGGRLEARVDPAGDFEGNARATIDLPADRPLRVAVYSNRPEILRPVLAASMVEPVFRHPYEYRPEAGVDIVIFDRFAPAAPPQANAIWIEPPRGSSPVPVRENAADVTLSRWRADNPLGAGLRAKDVRLDNTEVFYAGPQDTVVAEIDSGPVILAREQEHKFVVMGFNPVAGSLRYELTTPLLFANILRWMAPDIFKRWELNAGSVGIVTVDLGQGTQAAGAQVVSGRGRALPYTVEDHSLRFFTAERGTVRVMAGDREIVYSLSLPQVAEARWKVPAAAHQGIPRLAAISVDYTELWPLLALLGAAGLLAEWMLFGRARIAAQARSGR
jgi:hypothetical protein